MWNKFSSSKLTSLSLNQVTKIAEAVHRQFLKNLKQVSWFDDQTKMKAISKALKINLQIGYPDQLLDSKQILDHYSNVSFYY